MNDEQLAVYLAGRDAERQAAVDRVLAKLTPRERHLLHDAAVMGYVEGWFAGRGTTADMTARLPADSVITARVITSCIGEYEPAEDGHPGRFLLLGGLAHEPAPTQEGTDG